MKTLIAQHSSRVATLFSDPAAGMELMRRIASPREGWWRRVFARRVRVRRARFGEETIISERLE